MELKLGILFGVLAMIGWGAGDFVAARALKEMKPLTVLMFGQLFGLLPYIPLLPFYGFMVPTISELTLILCAALILATAYLSLYKGLQIGKVTLITPISACWVIVTVTLSTVLLGESLDPLKLGAVTLAILGGVLATFKTQELLNLNLRVDVAGIQYALLAMLALGIYYILLDILVSQMGWFMPPMLVRTVLIAFLLTFSIAKTEFSIPSENRLPLISLIGALEFIAFYAYGIGINMELTSVVAPISAASPVVSVLLANTLTGEKIEPNQKLGISAVIAAIILMSI